MKNKYSFEQIEKMRYDQEDLECAHMYLDDLNIPRKDETGEKYSIVGRIKQLQQRKYFIGIDVATFPDYSTFNNSDISCLHDKCSECHGTGKKSDESMCIHFINCSCPKCNPC